MTHSPTPRRPAGRYAAILLALLAGGTAWLLVKHPRSERTAAFEPVTEAKLLAADSAPGEWLSHGRNYANQRYSPLSEINRSTVARLTRVWAHEPRRMFRRAVRNESTPIIVDNMLLYTIEDNLVFALDARTGRVIWRHQHQRNATALCCGPVNRGVAVYGESVFLATLDARLLALDRRTGALRWARSVAQPKEGYSFTSAPLAAAGKVIVGASGGEFPIRGFLDAYDAATGDRVWRFWTVPSPREGGWWGRWSKTTPYGIRLPRNIARERHDSTRFADAWRHGGAGVWTTPAYDPELGLVIFTTGNPALVDGVIPPGDNLYSTSLVAVDVGTGRLRWYHQMLPHNIWEYDAASPPILLDIFRGGETIPIAAHAGKTGWVYLVDRRTGAALPRSEPLIPMQHVFSAPTTGGIIVSPGPDGGTNWTPAAYSPRTRLFYVQASDYPMLFRLDSARGTADFHRLERPRRGGTFTAIDPSTGRIRWQRKTDNVLPYGGALATAGDLVFFGEMNGSLDALQAETGEMLWSYQVDKGPLGPPIAFEVDGHERIAVVTRHGVTVLGLGSGR